MSRDQTERMYHRPNQQWVCTGETECSCPNGPDPMGNCQERASCRPVLENQRWNCARPDHRGGKCESGPDPTGKCCLENPGCVPVKSLRSRRKVFVVSFLALVTGILLLGVWNPNRAEFLAPGPLSSPHAQLWQNDNAASRCAACHDSGETGPLDWVQTALGSSPHPGQPQYKKCLNCHQELLGDENALHAHNLPLDRLQQLTAAAEKNNRQQNILLVGHVVPHSKKQNDALACANCHREHHGKDHNLSAMTDHQCQSCHANQFKSFEQGHPEFRNDFDLSRTVIQFDHFSHHSRHFAEAQKKFDCQSCHQQDSSGKSMLTASFEAACSSCHQQKLEASQAQGFQVFALPSLDVDLLRSKGFDIGTWPESLSSSFDGKIPPPMKLLLSTHPAAAQALESLGQDFDLFDIDVNDKAQLKAASDIAVAIKSLLKEASLQGRNALTSRMDLLSNKSLSHKQLDTLFSGLPSELFASAQELWFPNFNSDTADSSKSRAQNSGISQQPDSSVAESAQDSAQKIALAGFQESDKNNLLIDNPLKQLQEEDSAKVDEEEKQPQAQAPPAANFESLPEAVTTRPPLGTFPDQIGFQYEPKQVRKNPYSTQAKKQKARSLPRNSVGNLYYFPRTEQANDPPKERQYPPESTVPTNENSKPGDPTKTSSAATDGSMQPKKELAKDPNETAGEPVAENRAKQEKQPAEKQPNDSLSKQEDLLIENPLTKLLQGESQTEPTQVDQRPDRKPIPEDHPMDDGDSTLNNTEESSTQAAEQKTPARPTEPSRAPRNPVPGEWYLDRTAMAIVYYPSGHNDKVTREWNEFVIKDLSVGLAVHSEIKNQLANPAAPGMCASCHRLSGDESEPIQWNSISAIQKPRGFTRFVHQPHLVQSGQQCTSCHQLETPANIASFASLRSTIAAQSKQPIMHTGFKSLSKSSCVNCHNERTNNQSCTQCHNYHVGESHRPSRIIRELIR